MAEYKKTGRFVDLLKIFSRWGTKANNFELTRRPKARKLDKTTPKPRGATANTPT
jgi:hypothetical protein